MYSLFSNWIFTSFLFQFRYCLGNRLLRNSMMANTKWNFQNFHNAGCDFIDTQSLYISNMIIIYVMLQILRNVILNEVDVCILK